MKKKKLKTESADDLQKKLNKMSEEESASLETLVVAEEVYDTVVDCLGIPEEDEVYRGLVKGMLKRQSKDHLIFAIWNNLDDEQAKHLRDFANQTSITAPFMSHEDVLMEFAMMYPALMEKVRASLSDFFKKFIENFGK